MSWLRRPKLPKIEVPPPPDTPALAPEARNEAESALAAATASREAAERQQRWVDVLVTRLKRLDDEDKFTDMVEKALRGQK